PLLLACSNYQKDIVELLLKYKADIEARTEVGDNGFTPLLLTIQKNLPDLAEFLIDSGANAKVRDRHGNTALHWAAYGKESVAASLVKHGADVNALNSYEASPLHFAAGSGSTDVAALLLDSGAAVNQRDKDGTMPLDWVYRRGGVNEDDELVKLL